MCCLAPSQATPKAFCCGRIKPWMGGSVTNSPPSVVPFGSGGGVSPCTLWYPCMCSFSRSHFVRRQNKGRHKASCSNPHAVLGMVRGWVGGSLGGGIFHLNRPNTCWTEAQTHQFSFFSSNQPGRDVWVDTCVHPHFVCGSTYTIWSVRRRGKDATVLAWTLKRKW